VVQELRAKDVDADLLLKWVGNRRWTLSNKLCRSFQLGERLMCNAEMCLDDFRRVTHRRR
jgi:hypothetical protein